MCVTTPFGPATGLLFSNFEYTYMYKKCECNIKLQCFVLEYGINFTL